MAIRVTDSFTDVAGTLLENHTGETGATWTKRSGDTGSIVVTDANRVRPNVGSAGANYFPSGQLLDEQDISVDLHFKSDLDEHTGVLGRSTGPTATGTAINYYRARYSNTTTATTLALDKVINGTVTTLQSVTLDLNVAGATNRMRLQIRAATKKVFVGTTEYLSNTDDTVPLNPNVAIFTSAGTASSNTTGLHLDSFEAADTSQSHALSGTISGGSATSASQLNISHALTGRIAGGSSTAVSGLSLSHPLTGSISGGSSVAAPGLTLSHPLTGLVSGSSAVGADRLTVSHALSGSLTGSSGFSATSLAISHALTGTIHGSSSVSGILSTKEFRELRRRSYLVGL